MNVNIPKKKMIYKKFFHVEQISIKHRNRVYMRLTMIILIVTVRFENW